MENSFPEWLRPRCPMSAARNLGGTTRRQRMGPQGYRELGRLAARARLAGMSDEEVAASAAHARAARALQLWRAAGYQVEVVPMPYIQLCVLEAVRDQPGIHARGVSNALGLYNRSVMHAGRALVGMGYLADCEPAQRGHGKRLGLVVTAAGLAALDRVESALRGQEFPA